MNHDHHGHHDHQEHIVSKVTTTMMNHIIGMIHPQTNTTSSHVGHNYHGMHVMSMTFHGGVKEQILFKQWDVESVGAFIGSWFIIFFVGVLYEGLKTVRDFLARREIQRQQGDESERQAPLVSHDDQRCERTNNNNILPRVRTESTRNKRARLLSSHHIIQTILHILQMGISYLLMLVAMTFNIYLFLAVILGAGVGHFLFGWRRTTIIDYNEHCH